MLSVVRYLLLGLAACTQLHGAYTTDDTAISNNSHASQVSTATWSPSDLRRRQSNSSATNASTATCPSRTVNYITHTLAQQCLRTDWKRSRDLNGTDTSAHPTSASITASTDVELRQSDEAQNNVSTTTVSADTTTVTTSTAFEAVVTSTVEIDDSPLDNANFLSFDEWKKQNLAKVGQSGDALAARQALEPGRRPPNVNALDSLGEESEIELDFSGFGTPIKPETGRHASSSGSSSTPESSDIQQVSPAAQALRPIDAGKTCKERTNYASFDCAATVLKSNQECKSASSVLVENKDSYMLNKCSASNKYFIVELCNDILIDTVVLANYEFFSSIFRTFRVSVSDRYPAKAEKWKDLGMFEARNTREVQAFLIENPLIWARYLRIEFLTHYGSEYYCPVSLLRVHGTTMMEEFRNQEELARGEVQDDDNAVEVETVASPTFEVETPLHSIDSKAESGVSGLIKTASSMIYRDIDDDAVVNSSISQVTLAPISPMNTSEAFQSTCPHSAAAASSSSSSTTTTSQVLQPANSSIVAQTILASTKSQQAPDSPSAGIQNTTSTSSQTQKPNISAQIIEMISSATGSVLHINSAHASSELSKPASKIRETSITSSMNSKDKSKQTSSESIKTGADTHSQPGQPLAKSSSSTASQQPQASTKSSASSSAPPAQPSTQESFFKSISKRLQQLESNSTLSLQYIEEQSRILRDAFSKVEKRQITTTASFLSMLNSTVMTELAGFRQAYDQLWQSTVIELEGQREQHQREMTALSTRLTLVVDELVWQKRMGIVQSTLLLLCLGLVLFARPKQGSLEASLMQQVMARSQAAFRSGPGSDQNSPAVDRSPVSLIRRKLWHGEAGRSVEQFDASTTPHPSSPEESRSGDLVGATDSTYDDDDDDEEVDDASEASLEGDGVEVKRERYLEGILN